MYRQALCPVAFVLAADAPVMKSVVADLTELAASPGWCE